MEYLTDLLILTLFPLGTRTKILQPTQISILNIELIFMRDILQALLITGCMPLLKNWKGKILIGSIQMRDTAKIPQLSS